jgi:glycosyltransferase involved in cell wall biosynthesis
MKGKVIVHIITGLNNGGAEAVLFRLVTNDRPNKHIIISMMGMGKYGALLREAGILVRCLNMPKGRVNLKGLIYLWKLIRRSEPDVVQTWMYHADIIGGALARLAGVRNLIWGVRNSTLVPGLTSRTTILVARLCATASYLIPYRIVTCAQRALDVHIALGYSPSKFFLIPNGYDLNHYKPDSHSRKRLRLEWGINERVTLLGMVARFDPQKDIDNFLQALKIVSDINPNFHCVLIGSGMDMGNTQLIESLTRNGVEKKVSLLGPHNHIAAVMNALDIHILSSKFGEAFPNVLAEAMACGTPCISTDVGDAKIIINNTGWIVPPQSPQSLSGAILEALELIKEKERWNLLQQECRNHIVDNFSIDRMVNTYHTVWTNIKL